MFSPMSKRKVKVKTKQGERIYYVNVSSGKYFCYKDKGLWGGDKIGAASNLEDALVLIRTHAGANFGGVKDIELV